MLRDFRRDARLKPLAARGYDGSARNAAATRRALIAIDLLSMPSAYINFNSRPSYAVR